MILHTSCARCRQLIRLAAPSHDQLRANATCTDCEPLRADADRRSRRLESAFLEAVLAENLAEADRLADTLDRSAQAETGDLRAAAVRLAALGWPVFPLTVGGKVPATPNGFKDATTDIERVDRYWSRKPMANIGVATGHLFDVVDVDYKVPGAALRWADIRDTESFEVDALVNTPRGLHAYVLPKGDGNSAHGLMGIDYRGRGGYVVVPPSVRPDGNYRWWSNPSPRILRQ